MIDFKQFELQGWEASVDQYDTSFGRLTRQTVPRMLDVLAVTQGTRFLDIACGPGYLAAAAAEQGASAAGVDFSPAMVERAKHYYPKLAFTVGDAENLHGFADGSLDAVGMNFGILHLADPEKALRAVYRVLAEGGRAAFTVWRPPHEAIGFALVLKAIEQFGNSAVPLPQGPAFFQYSDPDECARLLERCGFSHNIETVNLSWKLENPDELFSAFYQGTARTGGLLRRQRPEDLAKIRATVRDAALEHRVNGEVVLPMPAQLAWGIRG